MRDRMALFRLGFREGFRRPVGERTIMVAATGSGIATAVGLVLYAWLG